MYYLVGVETLVYVDKQAQLFDSTMFELLLFLCVLNVITDISCLRGVVKFSLQFGYYYY